MSFFIVSCDKKIKTDYKEVKPDKLLMDTLYNREWLRFMYGNNQIEDVEIYINKKGDTISNQYKSYKNKDIDTLNGQFYDLEISKTNKPNIYKGQITIHSKYDKLVINKRNRKTLEFHYFEQNSESIRVTTLKTKKSNTINFEYENIYGNRLQGLIYLTVERDTIVNDEKMVNLFMLPILVDNKPKTDNKFLKGLELDKKRKFSNKLKER